MNTRRALLSVACTLLVCAVARADLNNPDFESQLDGWTIASGSVAHSGDPQGGFASFMEASFAGPAASSLYQDFTIGALDETISFEYSLLPFGSHEPQVLPDAFTARLIDPGTLQPLVSTPGVSDFFYHDARGIPQSIDFDSAIVTLSSDASRTGWSTVMLNVRSLAPGTSARLQFDLLGTGLMDGQLTFAGVDNLGVRVIPAPSAAVLGLIGLGAVRTLRRRLQ